MKTDPIRFKFILSAAVGMALAMVVGYPMGGWMLANDAANPKAGSTPAFYLAKAGVDRALWQMNQRRANLQALVEGGVIPGCDDDHVYSDVPGGTYKVVARYDRAAKEFRITGTGFESETGKRRSLELTLRQQPDRLGLLQKSWREVPARG